MHELLNLTPEDLRSMTEEQIAVLVWLAKWRSTARDKQKPPPEPWSECGVLAGRGFGKLGCKNTNVPTPVGWRKLGELSVGDQVFDEHGAPCRILAIHEPPVTKAYRLTFSDGTTIDCCEDHLWVTWTHRDRKQYLRHGGGPSFPKDWVNYSQPLWDSHGNEVGRCGPEVRTTQQIVDTLTHSTRGDANHCIPTCGDLQYPEKTLPLDPWLLGYWLGNGATDQNCISTHQDDTALVRDRYAAAFALNPTHQNGRDFTAQGLQHDLRALGVLGDKHAPEVYLQGSPTQRRALLAGLLDSDGHCSKIAGHVEFCSTSKRLADAVVELARSLGQKPVLGEGRATLSGEDYGPKYRVTWRSTFNPFSLPRKAAAWKPADGAQGLRNRHRMIVKAEEIAPKPMRCLTVDSPNHMFLWGDGMIPTHNSLMGGQWLSQEAYFDPEGHASFVIAPTLNDVRHTCFEGPTGILNSIPLEIVEDYNKTNLIITIRTLSGKKAIIRGFSSEEPERLRGPQCARIWGDEIAAWTRDEETWDMAMMGLRLGAHPKVMWTTTPKPKEFIRKLAAPKPNRVIITGTTYENREHLPASFFEQLKQYEGTQLGRQELNGELIDAEEGGIIQRSWLRKWPHDRPLPKFDFIVMSLDTAFTEKTIDKRTQTADPTACSVWGVFWLEDKRNILLLDCWEDHLGLPNLIKRVKTELNTAYGDESDQALISPLYGPAKLTTTGRKPDILIIEDKGSGISLRQSLEREGIEAYAYNPGRADKTARLHAVSHIFARQMVWVPESAKYPGRFRTWAEPFVSQLCSFSGPGSLKHDDYVDTASQALRYIIDKGMVDATALQPQKSHRYDLDAPTAKPKRGNPYAA